MMWVELDGSMLSEKEQEEKDKYPMISLMCGVLKKKLMEKKAAEYQNLRVD